MKHVWIVDKLYHGGKYGVGYITVEAFKRKKDAIEYISKADKCFDSQYRITKYSPEKEEA